VDLVAVQMIDDKAGGCVDPRMGCPGALLPTTTRRLLFIKQTFLFTAQSLMDAIASR